MIGHDTSEPVSKIRIAGMEGEERHDGTGEVFDVKLLGLFPSFGIGLFALGEALGGSLGFEVGLNPLDGR